MASAASVLPPQDGACRHHSAQSEPGAPRPAQGNDFAGKGRERQGPEPHVNRVPHASRGMGRRSGRGQDRMRRRARPSSIALAAVLALAAAAAAAVAAPPAHADVHDLETLPGVGLGLPALEIGALVTLGDGPFNDVMRLEAIRLAVDDYNRNATKSFSISLSVHEFDRSAPVESYRDAFNGGAGPLLFVGPTTSAPVAAIAGPATADGAVVVSPASSAMSLAVAGDAVFRLSPDGYLQASAIAAMVDDAGAGAAYLAAQDDTYGRDLAASLGGVLPLRGISVEGEVFFERGEEKWGGPAAELDEAVSSAGEEPAVVFIGVDEDFAGLAAEARAGDYPALAAARWFDSGAVENSPLVAADPDAAAFAESVGFATPVPSPPPTGLSGRIDRMVGAATGGSPHMFEYGAYDAVFLLAAAAESAGFPDVPVDGPAVGAALPAVAGQYVGALGDVRLDDAGDLVAPDDHAVWSLRGGEWERTGTVHAAREADANRALAAEAAAAAAAAAGGVPAAPAAGGGGCLVATAAYGTELAPQVQHLREMRDRAVERSAAGSYAVHMLSAAYYSLSPAAADALRGHPVLSAAADALLIEPIVTALSLGGRADPSL